MKNFMLLLAVYHYTVLSTELVWIVSGFTVLHKTLSRTGFNSKFESLNTFSAS